MPVVHCINVVRELLSAADKLRWYDREECADLVGPVGLEPTTKGL